MDKYVNTKQRNSSKIWNKLLLDRSQRTKKSWAGQFFWFCFKEHTCKTIGLLKLCTRHDRITETKMTLPPKITKKKAKYSWDKWFSGYWTLSNKGQYFPRQRKQTSLCDCLQSTGSPEGFRLWHRKRAWSNPWVKETELSMWGIRQEGSLRTKHQRRQLHGERPPEMMEGSPRSRVEYWLADL